MEALKKANQIPSNSHGKIMANGDVVNHSGEVVDNIKDYLP
jgi:hypothetical protein